MVNEQIPNGTQNRSNHRSKRRRKYGRPILYIFLALVLTLVLTLIGLYVGREKEVEVVSSVMPGVGIQGNWDENTKTLTVNGSGTVDESDLRAIGAGSNRDWDYIKKNAENIVFGDGVEGVTGFSDMPKLTTVQFDNPNVVLDPNAAFKNIPNLESVILPPGVTDDVQSNIMDALDTDSDVAVVEKEPESSQQPSEGDNDFDNLNEPTTAEGDSGNTGDENTGGENTGGENTGDGNTDGDNTGRGNTGGGNSGGGNTGGGNTNGGNSSGGNTGGSNASGGNSSGSNTSGGRGNTGGNGAATTPTTPAKPQDPDKSADTEKSDQASGTKNEDVPSRVIDDDMVDLPEVEEDELVSYPMFQLHLSRSDDTSIGLGWNQVPSAVGYELYSAYYNTETKKFEDIQVTTLDAPTMTAWICKDLKKNTYYKFIVRAYKIKKKKKVYLARSRAALVSTGESGYSSIQEVTVDKPQVTLRTGRTSVIQATVVAGSREIRPLYDLRFESTDSEIASVSDSGEITAEKRGTCTIYVFTQHGLCATVEVTVK